MFRRITLALAFVVALVAASVGLSGNARADHFWYGPSIGYGAFGPVGGYGWAGYYRGAYGPYFSTVPVYTYPRVIVPFHGHHHHGRRHHHGGHGHHRGGISISFGF
jgi:hypothetical protein